MKLDGTSQNKNSIKDKSHSLVVFGGFVLPQYDYGGQQLKTSGRPKELP